MESVLGVHEHRRGFDRSISGCVCRCVTTMLYSPYIVCIDILHGIFKNKNQTNPERGALIHSRTVAGGTKFYNHILKTSWETLYLLLCKT